MVVIAIVAILAAAAVPTYKNYKVRAAVSNSIQIATKVQTQVNEYYDINNAFPSVSSFAITNPNSDITSITWVPIWNGIEIWYTASSGVGGGLMLFPTYNSSSRGISWLCAAHHQSRIPCNQLPAICQSANPNGLGCS